jgi:glycine cleavage system H protein
MAMTRERYDVIPPDELRCCWMTAGVLAYQLCDRSFDCEHCPLDAALRKHLPPPARRGAAPRARRYSANHCWVDRRRGNTVRVGIEPQLAGALLPARAVVLPSVGQELRRGQSCVWIVMDGETFPVASPLDGQVSAFNRKVIGEPPLLHAAEEGWLFQLRTTPQALEEAGLLGDREAAARYALDAARLSEALVAETSTPHVGVTLADGGRPLPSAADLLGAKRYVDVLRRLFP